MGGKLIFFLAFAIAFAETDLPKSARLSSVRIVKKQGSDQSFASGTVISSERGVAIVLTCGHISSHHSDPQAYLRPRESFTVDYFGDGRNTPTAKYPATLIGYEREADVGLLEIRTDDSLATSPLISSKKGVTKKEPLVSLGCDKGKSPSLEPTVVKAINKFLGPHNITCEGQPVSGRSGGGLFNLKGELVGLTNGRSESDKEGVYCGHEAINALLLKHDLGHLIPDLRAKDNGQRHHNTSTDETNLPANQH